MKRPELIPAVLAFLVAAFFWKISPDFRDIHYLLSNTSIFAETGLLAIGLTLIIISGNIDLSVGSSLVLTSCLVAKFTSDKTPLPMAILMALVIGILLGTINGLLITKAKLPSFLVTLATMALYRGAAQAMMGPNSAKVAHNLKGIDRSDLLGLPYPLIIFLACALVVGILLHRMIIGRWLFGIGTNKDAAHYTGFPVDKATISAFAITGFLIGIAALIMNSRLGVARHDLGKGIELDAITIVVAGGTAISGGKGTMIGTLLSWLLLYFVRTGMGVNNIKAEVQLTIIGVILVLSVFFQQFADHFSTNRQQKTTKIQDKVNP
jgi:rhamnose transport system permease protein